MDFMKLLKSIEELLYELITWFVFYPLTLWRIDAMNPMPSFLLATSLFLGAVTLVILVTVASSIAAQALPSSPAV
ncbi:hypothetical protein SAMN05216456_1952 [Devosia crocina]|uniref:Uncharacterized protein n=1 Tax=Devosia crocina TaxID=429728 RepID=A0A1I7NIX7_9HYPH|nr:hypothetical protein [Devosia crocina]SFV34632.1 hypothetical protein SAMN05216456_1952 [Devosia crocina]